VLIAAALRDELVAHVLEDPTVELCGVVAVRPGPPSRAVRVHRASNIHATHLKFEIDPRELLGLWQTIEREGLELGAIYHSHTRTEPYPSQTDVAFAANWPGVEWVIVGLAGPQPDVRSYLIEGQKVIESPLEVVAEESVAGESSA
jgi:proteasome lid subunit RPN8/RPN11